MKQERQLVEKILRHLPSPAHSPYEARELRPLGATATRRSRTHRALQGLASARLRLGPGDDAAIVSPAGQADWVLSCDAFIENLHFRRGTHPPESVGYKSLARATSDLAAMGSIPRYFLLTLAIPKSHTDQWLEGFLRGMARASRELGIFIIGGDTTISPIVAMSLTVLGEVSGRKALLRSGASPGELIYVGGRLGCAELGLELVQAGYARDPRFRAALQPHLFPKIQIELGAWLAENRAATAMLDISDGLSTDLARLCQASGVGAEIYTDKIPRVAVPSAVSKKLGHRGLDPLQMALHGGEDYQLLFTVSPRQARRLEQAPNFRRLAAIGEITKSKQVMLVDHAGKRSPLEPLGWDPFSKKIGRV
jgi:thiamine-monophosphate kinase